MKKTVLEIYESERVILRPMREEDAEYVVKWRNDPDIKKWMFNQEKLTKEKHLEWFRLPKANRIDYMVCDKRNGKPIGTVNFTNIKDKETEAGKLLGDRLYLGKGYAKEAFGLWIRVGFKKFGFENIYVLTQISNKRNIELNKKLGFRETNQKTVTKNGLAFSVVKMEIHNEEK